MSLGCVACCRPLIKCITGKRINWALANRNGDSIDATPDRYNWQEDGEIYVSSCGHLYHKKCLTDLFVDGNPVSNITAQGTCTPDSNNNTGIPRNSVGNCAWCGNQMLPGTCSRIHLKPTGNPFEPAMLKLVNQNNKLRQQILRLTETTKKREALLEALESDLVFLSKKNLKKEKQLSKSSNEAMVPQGDKTPITEDELQVKETKEMINHLNAKLVTLLEESIVAKETMNELFGELKSSAPKTVCEFGCQGSAEGDHLGVEVRNRSVQLKELGDLESVRTARFQCSCQHVHTTVYAHENQHQQEDFLPWPGSCDEQRNVSRPMHSAASWVTHENASTQSCPCDEESGITEGDEVTGA